MINYNIGDPFQIPRKKACGHMGRIVWVSKDGNSIAVQCDTQKTRLQARVTLESSTTVTKIKILSL